MTSMPHQSRQLVARAVRHLRGTRWLAGVVTMFAMVAMVVMTMPGCGGTSEPDETTAPAEPAAPDWEPIDIGSTVGMRGLSTVGPAVVWISGQEGRFFHTGNAGDTWGSGQVPGMGAVDFRDVEAIDAKTAYLLSAGATARIYKTADGGHSWLKQYASDAPGVFFDGMAFWDPTHAIAFSDPVTGTFLVIGTDDGATWSPVPNRRLPMPVEAEAGFAGSGTNVAVRGESAWIGTGGGAARVLHSADRGRTWTAQTTPIAAGEGAGIFSLAFWSDEHGVAVGGNFQHPDVTDGTAAWTSDGGSTWTTSATPPRGYRSCVAVVPGTPGPTLVAVGPTGSDVSMDGGRTWAALSDTGFHAVAFPTSELGWAVGADGRVGRFRGTPAPRE